jgi:hypothetical protein
MQRDTDFTLQDIFSGGAGGSIKLEDLGDPPPVYSDLRFLEIATPQEGCSLDNDIICTLTERGEHHNELNYVAVSYCWDSFTKLNSDASPSTQVRIQDRNQGVPRPPKCPSDVLLRAISFARAKDVSLIWIDQECVNQADPVDVQNHLQCNHIIFNQAKHTIGLLSFELTNLRQFGTLVILNRTYSGGFSRSLSEVLCLLDFPEIEFVQYIARLLKAISRDRWFTRTWVLQERYSALDTMHLLVPISQSIRVDTQETFRHVGDDLPVSTDAIAAIAAILVIQLGSRLLEVLSESLELLHEITQEICGANLQRLPLNLLVENLQSESNLVSESTRLKSTLAVREQPEFGFIFQDMEKCDNRVVADRVTIFSNITGLRRRLINPTLTSYSLSILSLLWGNDHLPEVLLIHAAEAPATNPWRRASLGQVVEAYYELRKLFHESDSGKLHELENIKRILQRASPIDLTRHASLEELLEELKNETQQDSETYLSSKVLSDVILTTVLPLDCTIVETLGGIVHWLSPGRKELEAYHGESIIKYGVSSSQLVQGAKFVAFYGTYCWRPAFAKKVFNG